MTVRGAIDAARQDGVPAHMASEQLHADAGCPGARMDVFALGVVAYEMFAGTLAFGR